MVAQSRGETTNVLSELPDLDEDVSFVVDDGASTGPVPLRLIVASVVSGQRASNVLVWWAGATDWMRFDSHPDLVALLTPASAQEGDAVGSSALGETPDDAVMTRWGASGGDVVFADEIAALDDAETATDAEPLPLAEPAEPVARVEPEEELAPADALESEEGAVEEPLYVEFVDMEETEPVGSGFPDPVVEQFVAADHFVPFESPAAVAHEEPAEESHIEPAADPIDGAVPDSADDGVVEILDDAAQPADAVETDSADTADDAAADGEPPTGEPGAFSFGLPIREASAPEADEPGPAALTGLFSSGAREQVGLTASEPQVPSPDALDAIMAARMSLESVGARIDALTSATRRTTSPELQQSASIDAADDTGDSNQEEDGIEREEDLADERESVLIASVSSVETADVESTTEATPGGSWRAVEADGPVDSVTAARSETEAPAEAHVDAPAAKELSAAHVALTERFEEMVRKSVSHQRRIEWVMRVDELLLSACITAIADSGFVAMDLTSRDSDHRVLFDHNSDSRQVRLELSPVDTVTDHLGRHVRLGLSWGRVAQNIDEAFDTVERESVDDLIPPGVLTCDADMSSGIVSTHVELILAADDFVKDDYSVDRPSLDNSIAATLHALEARWHVLFGEG